MATTTYLVSATNGNDTNDGKDNVGVALSGTVIWTESTFTITESAGHGYTFSAGDVIYIDGGTGATVDLYEVVSSTSTTIVLKETSTLPRVGNASDFAAGDLATGDITSSDGPWKTVDKAMNTVSGSDDTIVFCRNEATYSESPDIQTSVTSLQQTCIFEGYGTSLGDDTKITIVGTLTDSIATQVHYSFKNIIFDANSANTNCVSLSSSEISWRKCKFINATGSGCVVPSHQAFWECDFDDNGSDGVTVDHLGTFINCRFYRNGAGGIDSTSNLVAYNCTFFSNATNAIDAGANNETHVIVINCTIDGDSKDTGLGVGKTVSFRGMLALINSIVYSCTNGEDASRDERDLYLNNLFNDNTADHVNTGFDQEETFVTSAPDFVDEVAGANYTLNSGSPAVAAGHDVDNNMDIGSHQLAAASGGGGLLRGNKQGGKQ